MSEAFTIQALSVDDFAAFSHYLNGHLRDNGQPGTGYFQPMSRAGSMFTAERAERFLQALQTAVGRPGWRRAWVARDAAGNIAGHVDLRAHLEAHAEHRCLLGLGVDRQHRRRGLARQLLAQAQRWARDEAGLSCIDLRVLSGNTAALRLYEDFGFVRCGDWPDMFRIDGHSLAYTAMVLNLQGLPSGVHFLS